MKQAAQRCSAAASEASVSCVRATERLAHARLRLETRDWTQVVSWAREEFRRCVGSPGPGPSHLPDSGACLLVALEEEAARSGDGVHPELTELVAAMTQLRPRSTSSASTWSGERLEALAAEVAAVLDGALEERAALEGLQALYRRYPVQTLAAVNEVLFDRHGYQACNRYGVPSDHQLAAVLEGGVGASAALSILYLEVCERLGFPLAARPLEDGRYFVVWPLEAPLTADGQRFLVDPYGRGGLLLLQEVCEIFGVEESSLLERPASRRQLLAALLGELRDAHWAAAAGCPPNPGSMTPLSAASALENKVQVPGSGVRAASLRRALAAAEKRLWLLPDDPEAQLQYGLLMYFSRRYDDAWIELSLFLERFAPSPAPPVSDRPGPLTGSVPARSPAASRAGPVSNMAVMVELTLPLATSSVTAGEPLWASHCERWSSFEPGIWESLLFWQETGISDELMGQAIEKLGTEPGRMKRVGVPVAFVNLVGAQPAGVGARVAAAGGQIPTWHFYTLNATAQGTPAHPHVHASSPLVIDIMFFSRTHRFSEEHPWAAREHKAYGGGMLYHRSQAMPVNKKQLEAGMVAGEPFMVREKFAEFLNKEVRNPNIVFDNGRPLPLWAEYKMAIHIDGISCSSKLWQLMALGNLVLREQSSYLSFYDSQLHSFEHYVPFWRHRPREIVWAYDWATRHDAAAARIAARGQAFAQQGSVPGSGGAGDAGAFYIPVDEWLALQEGAHGWRPGLAASLGAELELLPLLPMRAMVVRAGQELAAAANATALRQP
eukprot:XP_001690317.1 predicted protein [Chlamydomonas reinhardtii]